MKKIFGIAFIALGIGLEVMWLGVCFGSIIIGVLLLFFAPRILFFPFNFFLIIGLSLIANRNFKEYRQQSKNSYNYQRFKQYNNMENYYTILGCTKDDDMDIIKKSYRKLMKEYHYDSNVSKNLSAEIIKEYEEKSQKINEAYTAIKDYRK
jgi:hypothetical protein